ncbi:hypothetical protein EE896_22030 (plasmid) [Pantoea eucalypti]|uniref:hypothetical protein n=1 Tax=Pantoea eucalypti TaxID=470933 RepID=UPI001298661B|nr:hypothetical protein [Pantoea eucalypti]QGF29526.1 hypothetical protein EE896_22030 [Pantoea eucalypti]
MVLIETLTPRQQVVKRLGVMPVAALNHALILPLRLLQRRIKMRAALSKSSSRDFSDR